MGADETATRGTDESVPYDAIFVPAKHYNGTGKPVPYKVRCKTQQRTCVTRNVMVSANVPNRATRDMRIRRCGKSQLKERKKLTVMASLFRVISGYYTARVTLPLRRQRVHA